MSKWNSTEWEGLLNGDACPICLGGGPSGVVAELAVSLLTSGPVAPMRGACGLVLKRHAVEIHDLAEAEAFAFMNDLRAAGRAVQEITGAVKMNYEIHGNTIPHLHVHIFPRYIGDPFENGPIEPKRIDRAAYPDGEYEKFERQLRTKLGAS